MNIKILFKSVLGERSLLAEVLFQYVEIVYCVIALEKYILKESIFF
jgi:hypothetical protein